MFADLSAVTVNSVRLWFVEDLPITSALAPHNQKPNWQDGFPSGSDEEEGNDWSDLENRDSEGLDPGIVRCTVHWAQRVVRRYWSRPNAEHRPAWEWGAVQ